MIARIWRGITLTSKADEYLQYLHQNIIPCFEAADGNLGMLVLRDFQDNLAYFLLLSFWSSCEALEKFTYPDLNVAKQAPEEKELLIAYESIATHYEVVSGMNERGIVERS
ncbi:MAG: hypothetical protein ACM3PY_03180 [Omnitrophica WOR_2 bacterium]